MVEVALEEVAGLFGADAVEVGFVLDVEVLTGEVLALEDPAAVEEEAIRKAQQIQSYHPECARPGNWRPQGSSFVGPVGANVNFF